MVLGSGQEQVVAYRPSHAFPALAKRSVVPSPAREVPFARRHRLARGLVDRSASTALGSVSVPSPLWSVQLSLTFAPSQISQRFAVQDFCRSVTSSEASPVGPHHNNDPLADGIIVPKRRRRPEPVAGIARLINVWNPKMTLKPSNFKESAASKPCVAADAHGSHAHHPRASVDSLSPPCHDSVVRSSSLPILCPPCIGYHDRGQPSANSLSSLTTWASIDACRPAPASPAASGRRPSGDVARPAPTPCATSVASSTPSVRGRSTGTITATGGGPSSSGVTRDGAACSNSGSASAASLCSGFSFPSRVTIISWLYFLWDCAVFYFPLDLCRLFLSQTGRRHCFHVFRSSDTLSGRTDRSPSG